jgi:hypothetical protein
MPDKKIKVLFILGHGRSGSTLLDRMLGQLDGFFSMGELKWIWRRVVEEEVLCGCGTPFRSCPTWSAVFRQAFGGMENVSSRLVKLNFSLFGRRQLPLLIFPGLSRRYSEDLEYYTQAVRKVCLAAQDVSGCRLLIDSSKFTHDCVVLSRIPEIDLHVVHLVRDSRAVSYSWLRKKVRPEINSRTETMLMHSVRKSSFRWLWDNFLAHALQGFYKQYTRVYYEDFIDDPEGTILRICEKIGEPISSLDFLRGQIAQLGATHTVAGNPNRFDLGSVQIKPDMEWVEKMSRRDKAVTVAITWPLLMYYGYFSRGQKDSKCVKCTSS